ncbi:MAG: hypothetical protein MI674_04980 [Cytophagales bacterium]|nr:hypothetical protein [Cytophagales bacterium]
MNVIKKYWKWDEKFNTTDFKLGMDIQSLLNKDLALQNEGHPNEFVGNHKVPWRITTKNGAIISVFYREAFFPFYKDNLWDMEWEKFEETVDVLLVPANKEDKEDKGDLFYVVFRDFFIAIAGILRND